MSKIPWKLTKRKNQIIQSFKQARHNKEKQEINNSRNVAKTEWRIKKPGSKK